MKGALGGVDDNGGPVVIYMIREFQLAKSEDGFFFDKFANCELFFLPEKAGRPEYLVVWGEDGDIDFDNLASLIMVQIEWWEMTMNLPACIPS